MVGPFRSSVSAPSSAENGQVDRSCIRRDEVREAGRGERLVAQNEQSGAVDLQYAVERREFAGLIAVGLTPLFLAVLTPSRALAISFSTSYWR